MATPYVNLHRSALSAKTKRDSNFQEGMRRLRNMSGGVKDPERNQVLTKFMNQLRISGYDHRYRYDLLKGILERQDQIRQEIEAGNRVLYRSRQEIVRQKQARLGKHNNTWFLGKGIVNTLKIQPTPDSKLKSNIHKALNSKVQADKGKTKIVELGGNPITLGLKKGQNFGGQGGCHMGTRKCTIATDDNCRSSRVIYKISCLKCENNPNSEDMVYIGTSGHSTHKRNLEHLDDLRRGSMRSAITKHHQQKHRGEDPEFVTTVVKGGVRFNLDRFITEAIEIETHNFTPGVRVLNSKSEWGHRGLPRLVVDDTLNHRQ